ncbi:biofilm formation regulator HmsP [Edwardsiella hoshinae]|uniref:biofilm formation regulator HmsP n=2 Tax=Edwardsiella hoshinae TaxID=93378 RepID=UPI0034E289FB
MRRESLRVSRSLTIKQMTLVFVVALTTICVFTLIQLFHFVQQRKDDYGQQLVSIAASVRQPLSEAISNRDMAKAQQLLAGLQPGAILARAEIRSPAGMPLLSQVSLPNARAVPSWVSRLFQLPLQVSTPLYRADRAHAASTQPLGYLVLQVDTFRLYRFIVSTFATLVSTYLLLALILTVSVSWCMNRLLVHPLRALARELRNMPLDTPSHLPLSLPPHHHDDELGQLVRAYNRHQQAWEKARQRLSQPATCYPQTDLPNAGLFVSSLEQQRQARRGEPCVLMVAIPTLQEAMGVLNVGQREQLMATLVARLRAAISPDGMLAQASQDRFFIALWETSQPEIIRQQAHQLLTRLIQPITLDNLALRPVAAIGIAFGHATASHAAGDAHPSERLLAQAHSALHRALAEEKNGIRFFEPQLAEQVTRRLTQETAILDALRRGDFALYLQPQIDLRSGQLAGAEALIRWHHQDGRCSVPSQFIPLAEELGGIVALGDWMLDEAIRILLAWQRCGLMIPLSLNVSALQLVDGRFIQRVMQLLQQHGIDPHRLHLEVTETAYIDDIHQAAKLLERLRMQGVRVALDDFGMGYAGLNYLRHLPIDIIKIDKSFIDPIPLDEALVRIVGSIAEVLSLEVVAEGVENQSQCDWLLANGIHYAQGYYFSPALSLSEFVARYPGAAHH